MLSWIVTLYLLATAAGSYFDIDLEQVASEFFPFTESDATRVERALDGYSDTEKLQQGTIYDLIPLNGSWSNPQFLAIQGNELCLQTTQSDEMNCYPVARLSLYHSDASSLPYLYISAPTEGCATAQLEWSQTAKQGDVSPYFDYELYLPSTVLRELSSQFTVLEANQTPIDFIRQY